MYLRIQAAEEAKRKAAAEAEAKRKVEEEAKRKAAAEDEAKRKVLGNLQPPTPLPSRFVKYDLCT